MDEIYRNIYRICEPLGSSCGERGMGPTIVFEEGGREFQKANRVTREYYSLYTMCINSALKLSTYIIYSISKCQNLIIR